MLYIVGYTVGYTVLHYTSRLLWVLNDEDNKHILNDKYV